MTFLEISPKAIRDAHRGLPLAPAASLLPAPSAVSTAQESVVLIAVFGSWKPVQKQL